MSFWKRLFGPKESPKGGTATRESVQLPSEMPNVHPARDRSTPATPPRPTTSKAHVVPDQPEAPSEYDAERHSSGSPRMSLEAELLAAATKPVPDTWRTLKGRDAELRFPPTWLEGDSPEGGSTHNLIHPRSARSIQCGGKPMISPCVTVLAARGAKLEDEALLDGWVATRGQQFQGFILRESVKTTLYGMHALAMSHDFMLGSETWTCLMVLLVAGNKIWYADASGLSQDVLSARADLVSILASLKASHAEPAPAAQSADADRVKTRDATGASASTTANRDLELARWAQAATRPARAQAPRAATGASASTTGNGELESAKAAQASVAVPAKTNETGAALNANIHDATKEGDIGTVRTLLHGKPGLVFSKDKDGVTPLHWAAWRDDKDMAELLLSYKADVNSKTNNGWTPLHWAAYKGSAGAAELLMANKAEIDAREIQGLTPLYLAVLEGHKEVVEKLLAHHANVNAKATDAATPLHGAAYKGRKDVAELLLANKADVHAKSSEGVTPLYSAANGGHNDLVRVLVSNHADVNTKDNKGYTPLYIAAQKGSKDMAEFLLAHKAQVSARNNDGWTPLHVAAHQGHKDLTELLLANHAEVNAKAVNGDAPLDLAIIKGHRGVAELLLAGKAEVDAKDSSDRRERKHH